MPQRRPYYLGPDNGQPYFLYITDPNLTCLLQMSEEDAKIGASHENDGWRFVNKIPYKTLDEANDALLKLDILLHNDLTIEQKIRVLELLDMLPK